MAEEKKQNRNYESEISPHMAFRHRLLNTVAELLLYMRATKDKQALSYREERLVDKNVKDAILNLLKQFEEQASRHVQEVFRQRYRLLRRFKDIQSALELVPVLKTALTIYIDNIMSPDDITRTTFKVAHIEGLLQSSYEQFVKRIIEYLDFERVAEEALFLRLAYGSAGLLIKTPTLLLRRFVEKRKLDLPQSLLATETLVPQQVPNEETVLLEVKQDVTEDDVKSLVERVIETLKARKLIAEHGLDLVKGGMDLRAGIEQILSVVLEDAHRPIFDDYTQSVLKAYHEHSDKHQQTEFRMQHQMQLLLEPDGSLVVREQLISPDSKEVVTLRNIQVSLSVYSLPLESGQKPLSLEHLIRSAQDWIRISTNAKRIEAYRSDLLDTALDVVLEHNITDRKRIISLVEQVRKVLSQVDENELQDTLASITDMEVQVVHPSRFAPVTVSDVTIGYFLIARKGEKLVEPVQFDTATTFVPTRQALIAEFEKQLSEAIENLLAMYLKDANLSKAISLSDPTIKFLTRFLTIAQSGTYEVIFVPSRYFATLPVNADPELSKGILDSVLFFAKLYYIGVVSTQIYRLTRAPERFVYYVDIGAADRNMRVYEYLKRAIAAIKTRPAVLSPDMELDRIPSYIGIFEDLFIPVYNGTRAMEIETIQGGDLNSRIDDLDHLLRQLLSGLGVPPSLLGYTEEYEYRTTLANQNVRFAKTIIRFQKEVSQSFTELLHKVVYLVREKLYAEVAALYRVYLPPPRGLMLAELSELANAAQQIADVFADIYDKKLMLKWLLGDIIDLEKYSIRRLEAELHEQMNKIIRKRGTEEEGEENERGPLTL